MDEHRRGLDILDKPRTAQAQGVITALQTPFDESGAVDVKALESLVDFQISKKVHGLFPCGTAGVGPLMTASERKKVAEVVVRSSGGKALVIVHVGAADTQTAVDLAVHAEKIGADAIASVTPYYYHPDDKAIIAHYDKISKSVRIPLFAYNNPRYTGINLGVRTLSLMAGRGIIIGVKDSSRDFVQLVELAENLPDDFTIINGVETYAFPSLVVGARGLVSGLANCIPDLMVELYGAYEKSRMVDGLKIQAEVNRVKRLTEGQGVAAVNELLRLRGVDCGYMRAPIRPLDQDEKARLSEEWKKLGIE